MNDLVTWLREQIAETEQIARTASPGPWTLNTWPGYDSVEIEDSNGERALHNGDGYHSWPSGNGEHVVLHDPRAVLAQCEAHTAILDRAQFVDDHGPARDDVRAMDMTSGASSALRDVLCLLALAYQHRPGYREEWKP